MTPPSLLMFKALRAILILPAFLLMAAVLLVVSLSLAVWRAESFSEAFEMIRYDFEDVFL